MPTMKTLLAATVLFCVPLFPAQSTDLKPVLKVYIDKMPNDLDQCLRAEFSKQMEGRIAFVPAEKDADATITAFSMMNKDGNVLLWSDDLKGRDLMSDVMKPGEERKFVERFVSKLKRLVDK
jgi:hypothetical protein